MFMRPNVILDTFDEFQDEFFESYLVPTEYRGDEPDSWELIDTYENQWFARLSAPGYMDCTDWMGPFSSEEEALTELFDFYGSFDETIEEWEKELI